MERPDGGDTKTDKKKVKATKTVDRKPRRNLQQRIKDNAKANKNISRSQRRKNSGTL